MFLKHVLRAGLALVMLGSLLGPVSAPSQAQETEIDVTNYRATMLRLIAEVNAPGGDNEPNYVAPVFSAIRLANDPLYIAPLIDLGFFSRRLRTNADNEVFRTLAQLTDQPFAANWQRYFEWASATDIPLPPYYDEFKGILLATFLDPNFARFFAPGVQASAQVNMLEAVWGGVRVDGIPSLVNARQITPEAALEEGQRFSQFCREGDCSYPAENELVFGVSINGDSRAYPLRLLNWHEMFNDVIGSTPLYAEVGSEPVCEFRAPSPFRAMQRQGDDWVLVDGLSAGCPNEGWLAVEAVEWAEGDWSSVREALPEDEPLTERRTMPSGSVRGVPVMLAYCTLCGAGVLYDATLPDVVINGESQGPTTLEFGSTGMLMRSNKLMYDRQTDTVWNALTGTPAWGPLAQAGVRLEVLPVVVTDWASWLAEHPNTSVLSLDTGFRRNYTNGGAYTEYFNAPDLMFPVWQQDTTTQENKDMVFALNLNDTPKAYPLATLVEEGVTNDTLAGENVVIISRATPNRDFFEPGGAAVRAYQRGDLTFEATDLPDQLVDDAGNPWQITEEGLMGPGGRVLLRLGGHLAFWFGWFSFYPETLVYAPGE
ncbi:MAG: DUF3179 domain-containing protein [Anaerolineae bacterium]|nr:DUF3179 domain-containing protein [Anaerolineae bacterium]